MTQSKTFARKDIADQYALKDKSKDELIQWIESFYSPRYLMTIRLPEHWSSASPTVARTHLKNIMVKFQKLLLGRHWNKKHLPFICFAELGEGTDWHYHILLNPKDISERDIVITTSNVIASLKLSPHNLDVEPIVAFSDYVTKYCLKEIYFNFFGKFDSDVIILSHDLYCLPYKAKK